MQDYIDLAAKNGVELLSDGACQFCGAQTTRGIHECLEIFNLGFQVIDFSNSENHIYRFLIVDAHTLQHPEIHGRWSNHFHLLRLHLIIKYNVKWTYKLSPKLSDHLNKYKANHPNQYLDPPEILQRGSITTTDIKQKSINQSECKDLIKKWSFQVYNKWKNHHNTIDHIAQGFVVIVFVILKM